MKTRKFGYVYRLIDPRTDETRYIGSSSDPGKRYSEHLRHPVNVRFALWLQELRLRGFEPELAIDESGPFKLGVARRKEKAAIRAAVKAGCRLLNINENEKANRGGFLIHVPVNLEIGSRISERADLEGNSCAKLLRTIVENAFPEVTQ